MKKLILIIICLSIMDYVSFRYLESISSERKAYIFKSDSKAILIPKKDIILDSIEDFTIKDYFYIYAINDYRLNYDISDENVNISLDNKKYSFRYEIRKPEIVEVIVYKKDETIKLDNLSANIINSTPHNNNNQVKEDVSDFRLLKTDLSYPVDTDINLIISDILSCFVSSVEVDIDYSLLNPSIAGSYDIYLRHMHDSSILRVNIV